MLEKSRLGWNTLLGKTVKRYPRPLSQFTSSTPKAISQDEMIQANAATGRAMDASPHSQHQGRICLLSQTTPISDLLLHRRKQAHQRLGQPPRRSSSEFTRFLHLHGPRACQQARLLADHGRQPHPQHHVHAPCASRHGGTHGV